jgi:hypothetical protein
VPGPIKHEPLEIKPPPPLGSSSGEDAPMPMDRIEKPTLLDKQIEAIRAAVPGFNGVIVRSPGVEPNYPMLPPMTLRNVTIGQFMRFVQAAFPSVEVSRIEGPNGTVYAIRIRRDEDAERRARIAEQANRVRLFRLTEIVRAMAAQPPAEGADKGKPDKPDKPVKPEEERIKDATAHVLSLLQIAIEQTDTGAPYTLKIHEPTLTLLFKGSAEQNEVLEDALATLDPRFPKLSRGSAGAWRSRIQTLSPSDSPQMPVNPNMLEPLPANDFAAEADELIRLEQDLSVKQAYLKKRMEEVQRALEKTRDGRPGAAGPRFAEPSDATTPSEKRK